MEKLDLTHYKEKGWAVVAGLFDTDACDGLIEHMMALHAGSKTLEGFAPRAPDAWDRTHNQH